MLSYPLTECPSLENLHTHLEISSCCGVGFNSDDDCSDCKDPRELCQEAFFALRDCELCGMQYTKREGLIFPVSGLNPDNTLQCFYVCEDCYNKIG